MVLTHINRALIYLAAAGLWLAALSVQGHPGRTDAEGCHAGTQPRHCHGSQQSERPAQTNPGAPARDRAAWISAAAWTACSRRCFSVS